MYRKSTLVLLLAAAILTACKDKKEADCVAPTIEKNLLGTWQATFTSKAGNSGPSTVTFKENGTMTGIGSLFKNTSAPTYSWKDDSWEKDQIGIAFTLRGASSATEPFASFSKSSYYVDENECNKVVLRAPLGGTFELTR